MSTGQASFKWYVGKHLIQLPILLLFIIIVNFSLINLAPGDPVNIILGESAFVDPETIKSIRERLGLDRPLIERFFIYLASVAQGDLGHSYIRNLPVITIILDRVPATVLLMTTSIIISVLGGILLGVAAGVRPHSKRDYGATVTAVMGYSIPVFWLGQILIIIFGLYLKVLPVQGMTTPRMSLQGFELYWDIFRHLVLPSTTLALFQLALITRLTRTNMMFVLQEDYITTAYSKGLTDRTVIFRHALRNALLPVVSVVGVNMSIMLTGMTLTETVFAWPGVGRLLFDALITRDYPVIMGVFVIATIGVIIVTMVTDMLYAFLDPRIRRR